MTHGRHEPSGTPGEIVRSPGVVRSHRERWNACAQWSLSILRRLRRRGVAIVWAGHFHQSAPQEFAVLQVGWSAIKIRGWSSHITRTGETGSWRRPLERISTIVSGPSPASQFTIHTDARFCKPPVRTQGIQVHQTVGRRHRDQVLQPSPQSDSCSPSATTLNMAAQRHDPAPE